MEQLNSSIQYLKSIGPIRAKLLKDELNIETVADLIFHFPYRHIDRTQTLSIKEIYFLKEKEAKTFTIVCVVENFYCLNVKNKFAKVVPFNLVIRDEKNRFTFTFFRPKKIVERFWLKRFEIGETIAISALFEKRNGEIKYSNVEYDKIENGSQYHTGKIIPLYSATEKLREKGFLSSVFRKIVFDSLPKYLKLFDEFFPDEILQRQNLFPIQKAISEYHFPQTISNIELSRKRFAFEEIFFFELYLAIRRKKMKELQSGISFKIEQDGFFKTKIKLLPFELTNSQKKVLREIFTDMELISPMNRILQGDVGSGKTIVAILSMLNAIDNGFQSAFMVPTEVLAEQHFNTIQNFLNDIPIQITLLTGSQKKSLKEKNSSDIESGNSKIIIGTHAVIQEKVKFSKLGFIIIDEQHKFGVVQRQLLKEKSNNIEPDILFMSATPIPRTLSMTLYGDMEISVIDEMPKNRKKIITKISTKENSKQLKEFILKEIKDGRQIYIVYPLIEKSEKIDLKAAIDGFEKLRTKTFPHLYKRIGLLHGKMKSEEKKNVMKKFISHELDILVSTTVIGVGVDVSNATVMVIVNAERFGVSQIHQLRGRVGRGSNQSYCFLQTEFPFIERLQTLIHNSNGFDIAEVDLKLRGPGDYLGTRQSGIPEFKFLNLVNDKEIVLEAKKEAFRLIAEDANFELEKNKKIKNKFLEFSKNKNFSFM